MAKDIGFGEGTDSMNLSNVSSARTEVKKLMFFSVNQSEKSV